MLSHLKLRHAAIALVAAGACFPAAAQADRPDDLSNDEVFSSGCAYRVIPAGVTSLQAQVIGASGDPTNPHPDSRNGRGAAITVQALAVTPGDIYEFCVNAAGGAGGAGEVSGVSGGGAAYIRPDDSTGAPVVIAAGGGGYSPSSGAAGGDASMFFSNAGDGGVASYPGGNGTGAGHSPGTGGAGTYYSMDGLNGRDWETGQGQGGDGGSGGQLGGSGGGAGYYGGGGSGAADDGNVTGGGGGGYSYCDPTADCTIVQAFGYGEGAIGVHWETPDPTPTPDNPTPPAPVVSVAPPAAVTAPAPAPVVDQPKPAVDQPKPVEVDRVPASVPAAENEKRPTITAHTKAVTRIPLACQAGGGACAVSGRLTVNLPKALRGAVGNKHGKDRTTIAKFSGVTIRPGADGQAQVKLSKRVIRRLQAAGVAHVTVRASLANRAVDGYVTRSVSYFTLRIPNAR